MEAVAEDHTVGPIGVVLVELGFRVFAGEPVEISEEGVLVLGRGIRFFRLAEEVVNENLWVDFFLDVDGRGGHDEIGPVLLIFAAPDELGVEVAVEAGIADGVDALLVFVEDGLELRGGDVAAAGLVMDEGLDLFGGWGCSGFLGHGSGSRGGGSDSLINKSGEFGCELGVQICLHCPGVSEFGEGPAAVAAEVVDAGNPVSLHGFFLLAVGLVAEAFDFDDEVEGFGRIAGIDTDEEVRQVFVGIAGEKVGHLEAEGVVFGVGENFGVSFEDAAELGLPLGIIDDVVDVAVPGRGLPKGGAGGIEAYVVGGAYGVLGIEDGADGAGVKMGAGDRVGDLFAGHVGEVGVEELGGVGVALAD